MDRAEFYQLVRDGVKSAGSQRKAAELWGVSPQFVNDVTKERREPSEALLKAFGLCKIVTYESVSPMHDMDSFRCPECGRTPRQGFSDTNYHEGARWRWTGDNWEHYHGYGAGHIPCVSEDTRKVRA